MTMNAFVYLSNHHKIGRESCHISFLWLMVLIYSYLKTGIFQVTACNLPLKWRGSLCQLYVPLGTSLPIVVLCKSTVNPSCRINL